MSPLDSVEQGKLRQLEMGTLAGAIRLAIGAHQYLNYEYGLSPDPTPQTENTMAWVVDPTGQYQALNGYWIYKVGFPNTQAMQCVETNGPLETWNKHGGAKPPPQDWELFKFEVADMQAGSVRLKNVYGRFVRFNGNKFVCDGAVAPGAAVFYVEF